jgi:hypothetical protein
VFLAQVGRLHACTPRSARMAAGDAAGDHLPLTITVKWSASAKMASMSCSTSIMAWSF